MMEKKKKKKKLKKKITQNDRHADKGMEKRERITD